MFVRGMVEGEYSRQGIADFSDTPFFALEVSDAEEEGGCSQGLRASRSVRAV